MINIHNSDNSFTKELGFRENYTLDDIYISGRSFTTSQESIISYPSAKDYTRTYPGDYWIRPSDWLVIDNLVTDGEQKMVGLHAVWPSGNTTYVNYCTIYAQGKFTVDWGDGSVINYNSAAYAYHEYNYDNLSDDTYCSRGYKQVIVTVTPQNGSNLTYLYLGYSHSARTMYNYSDNWLDIILSGTEIIRFFTYIGGNVSCSLLERFRGYQTTNKCTDMSCMFTNCTSLKKVDLTDWNTSNVTNMTQMFYSCNSLSYIDVSNFDTSKITTMNSMFLFCTSLKELDLSNFNTSNVTNMNGMFRYCYSLQCLNLSSFNTSNVTTMVDMFSYCYTIQKLDLSSFNTSKVTNMINMILGCYLLKEINISSFDTSLVVYMSSMFNSCWSLIDLDLSNFNTSNVIDMGYMFNGCYSLRNLNISSFDTQKNTTMYRMFRACNSLENLDISNFNTSLVTTTYQAFQHCYKITSVNLSGTTLSAVTTTTDMFTSTGLLTEIRLPDISKTFSIASNKLDANALNNLFTDLKDLTGFTAQTITITGNPGAATCDKTIATNKNWTVVS